MAGEHSYSFNTGGPKILMSSPRQGGYDIDEQQVFILGLDAPATSEHRRTRGAAQGINERIGVRLLTGAERQRVLDQRKDLVERHLVAYYRARGVVWSARLAVRDKRLEQLLAGGPAVQARLPAKAEVTLVWGAGIAAENGMSSAQDQHWSFSTRPDFTAALVATS
jgi:hypothetical protein